MNEQERKHRIKRTVLRVLGAALALAGLGCSIAGFVDLAKAFGERRMPMFWLFFIGFPAIAFGIFLIAASMQRAINRYIKDENAPVFNEMGQQIAPGLSAISGALRAGAEHIVCHACGTANEKDAQFCKNCGQPLSKVCPKCGEANSADAKFCDKCGTPLK